MKSNYKSIIPLINLIENTVLGVHQYSIMGLEPTGYAKSNWQSLSLSPSEKDALFSSLSGLHCKSKIKLFNFRLCELPNELRSYAVTSISEWKNYYPDICFSCTLKNECCGFFVSERGKFYNPPIPIIQ